jgi:Na+-transporting methylmalonyl-CoA/oxaloacetate decarboxylase gamma subunit
MFHLTNLRQEKEREKLGTRYTSAVAIIIHHHHHQYD